MLPDGLIHELPTADFHQKAPIAQDSGAFPDDLDELRKHLDALNAA